METVSNSVTKKEKHCDLRKKAKRFQESRDNLKAKNREKAGTIKKLSDRITELKSSRNHWREKSSQVAKKCRTKEIELERAVSEVDALKAECDQLRQEVETFKKKKKTRIFW